MAHQALRCEIAALALLASTGAGGGVAAAESSGAAPGPAAASATIPSEAPAPSPSPTPTPLRTLRRVSIGAVGDVLMHGPVKESAAAHTGEARDIDYDGYGWLFEPVADLMWQPDVMFANLETPVAPRTGKRGRAFVFNAPIATLKALQRQGIDLVSVANNHAFDQGRAGFLETIQHLEMLGLRYVGGGPTPHQEGPVIFERNGMKIAFLAWTETLNQDGNGCKEPCEKVAVLDEAKTIARVKAVAPTVDALIVSLHWGREYADEPTAAQRKLAHRLADAGAMVIVGHHPHVLQPVEVYERADGRPAVIAYSLGNFISNQSSRYVHGVAPESGGDTRDGALLRFDILERDYGNGVRRIEVGDVDYVPLWTENNRDELRRRHEPDEDEVAIRVVAVDRALADVRTRLAAFPDPVPEDRQGEFIELRRLEDLYATRKDRVAERMGRELLRVLPAPPHIPTDAASRAQ